MKKMLAGIVITMSALIFAGGVSAELCDTEGTTTISCSGDSVCDRSNNCPGAAQNYGWCCRIAVICDELEDGRKISCPKGQTCRADDNCTNGYCCEDDSPPGRGSPCTLPNGDPGTWFFSDHGKICVPYGYGR